jgi:phage baseplate assembly protein W|tara:strand:+ start:4862 stop:5350 length:489 start_codon:yes stop_codon:yes gene_type:complete
MAKVKLTKTTTSDKIGSPRNLKTYVGFSTVNRDFDSNTLYDYELARTDLLNALYIKKGEKLELPDYGTIIYDLLFEPFTSEVSKAVEEDIIEIVDRDPRWVLEVLAVTQAEYGLNIALDLLYVPYQIKESLTLGFDQEQGLQVTSNAIQAGETSAVASAGSY